MIKHKSIYIGETRFGLNIDTNKNDYNTQEYNHLIQLIDQGYLKRDFIKSIANMPLSKQNYDLYNVSIPKHSEEYIVKKKESGLVSFKMYENKASSIENIKMLSETKAEVQVVYKKIKPPFYSKYIDSIIKGKPDTYTETLTFIKSSASGWMNCHL